MGHESSFWGFSNGNGEGTGPFTPTPQSFIDGYFRTHPAESGNPAQNDRITKANLPQSGTPHRYSIRVSTVCPAEQIFNNLKEPGNSAPGAPAAIEGKTRNIQLAGFAGGTNPITQIVNSRAFTIVNITQRGHIFYPGQVTIRVIPEPGNTSDISIVGTGTGNDPLLNEVTGLGFFGLTAEGAADLCASGAGLPSMTTTP